MDKSEKIEAYYAKEHPFKEGINELRELALKTEADEALKWGSPIYTVDNKNVFGVLRFKDFFGVWFFNGAFMSDPKNVLRNAQEGKTKAMRHWNFTSIGEIDKKGVLGYMKEAIQNQKEGKVLKPTKSKSNKSLKIPEPLSTALKEDSKLKAAFANFTPYKQKEFCEHIEGAKQEATKLRRLNKIIPMIKEGVGLNDKYR